MQSLIGQKSTISLVQERPFDSLAAQTRQRRDNIARISKYEKEFRGEPRYCSKLPQESI